MRILLASHTAVGGIFTVGSHHLARELRDLGHEVLHLSTPVSLLHLLHLRDPEVRRRFGLALRPGRAAARGQYVPLTLLPTTLGPRLLSRTALRTALPPVASGLRRRGFAEVDVLLVDQPLLAGVQDRVRARAVVYRSTDLVEDAAKSAGERDLLAAADAVVGTSPVVLEHLRSVRPDVPGLLLENGVEFEHFATDGASGPDVVDLREGAVYVGAIDGRFDWDGLVAMADANPDVPVTVCGPVEVAPPGEPGDLPANIDLRGPVSYDEAARQLARAKVGILPFTRSPLNSGRSPMKFYEYLAAGLNVVTTLPAADPGPGVFTADAGGGGEALRLALRAPANADGVELARGMDWRARAVELVRFLDAVLRPTGS